MAVNPTPASVSNSEFAKGDISERRKTALAAIQAFHHWTIDSVMAVRSDDCIHQILPQSLGHPPRDNAAYRMYFGANMPHFRNFTITINELIEDSQANKICIWASSTAETDLGMYANEYMLVFYFNEEGDKITKFLEFVDGTVSLRFLKELKAYIVEKSKASGVA